MPDFAARVLKLVSEPDYKPITLKAMSRRFEIDPDDYAEFRSDGQAARQGGEARPAQGQDAAPARPDRADRRVFRRSARGFGFVRPHTATAAGDQIYISPDAGGDASSGDEVAVKITKRPRRPGMNIEGGSSRFWRGPRACSSAPTSRTGTGVRPDRRHHLPRPDLRGRPRRQGCPAGRQGRASRSSATRRLSWKAKASSPRSWASAASPGSTPCRSSAHSTFPTPLTKRPRRGARAGQVFSTKPRSANGSTSRDLLTVTIDPATARDFDDAISL